MKKVLISVNLLLAVTVAFVVFGNISLKTSPRKKPAVAAKSSSAKKSSRAVQEKEKAVELLPVDEAAAKIVEKDVFNQIRSPLANMRVGRADMTLVGVFRMGEVEGAIIKTSARQMQFNPFLAQAMRMSGEMSGNRGGGMMGGRFTQWSQVSGNRSSAPAKQYVRLGETMSNGYTLAEVSRSRAVLVRGNDKLELELQDPSKNRAAAAVQSQPRLNAAQQFQQAQMFMQSQMIRTMREIQQNSRSQAPAGNRNRR